MYYANIDTILMYLHIAEHVCGCTSKLTKSKSCLSQVGEFESPGIEELSVWYGRDLDAQASTAGTELQ